ncbi:MAG TPA: hypothetical protein VM734_26050 [Kofleriaceae bacterium]|jgi:hypothetical protein|nr:hypothetical protein [Kofleriaceae bacterium]
MVRPEPTPAPEAVTVAVIVRDRSPYAMFDAIEVTATTARLRGPLLLELGERLRLRVARGATAVEVGARVTAVQRGDGHADPVTDLRFDDEAAGSLRPIVS